MVLGVPIFEHIIITGTCRLLNVKSENHECSDFEGTEFNIKVNLNVNG